MTREKYKSLKMTQIMWEMIYQYTGPILLGLGSLKQNWQLNIYSQLTRGVQNIM